MGLVLSRGLSERSKGQLEEINHNMQELKLSRITAVIIFSVGTLIVTLPTAKIFNNITF